MELGQLDGVTAELVPHDGEHPVSKRIGHPGADPFEQRQRDHRAWNIRSDCFRNHPSAFAGIRNLRADPVQRGVLVKSLSSKIQEPGTDNAAVSPGFRHLCEIESKLLLLFEKG